MDFLFLILPLLMISFGSLEAITITPFTNKTDYQAYLAIKDLIPGDPFLVFHSWNQSINFCNWQWGYMRSPITTLKLSSHGFDQQQLLRRNPSRNQEVLLPTEPFNY